MRIADQELAVKWLPASGGHEKLDPDFDSDFDPDETISNKVEQKA